jgi:hypothetical protein
LAPWGDVTHITDPAPVPGPAVRSLRAPDRWAAVRVSAAAGGAAAAALGLGGLTAVVLLLWITSPYPDSGLGGALHIVAALWLLAQGAELVRTATLSGDPAPIALTPLLLSALPAWLLYRGASSAVSSALDPEEGRTRNWLEAALVTGWLLAGYLSVAAIAVAFTAAGPVRVDVPTALYVPLFAVAAAGCGAWVGYGRPVPTRVPYGEEAVAALRAAGIALGILVGGGALLGGVSLAWHAGFSGRTYAQLSGPFAGQIAVLLIAVALVPNLAVWGACYGLGAGFSVGVGSAVGPAGAFGYGLLPQFPLLAALPRQGAGGWLEWATLALPAGAAGVVGWSVGHRAWAVARTARVAAAAALFLGLAFAVLAAWSGGALGVSRLAAFGPTWWHAAPAATAWTLALALPLALTVRWHLAHPLRPWHTLCTETWRSLRRHMRAPAAAEPGGAVSLAVPGPGGVVAPAGAGPGAVRTPAGAGPGGARPAAVGGPGGLPTPAAARPEAVRTSAGAGLGGARPAAVGGPGGVPTAVAGGPGGARPPGATGSAGAPTPAGAGPGAVRTPAGAGLGGARPAAVGGPGGVPTPGVAEPGEGTTSAVAGPSAVGMPATAGPGGVPTPTAAAPEKERTPEAPAPVLPETLLDPLPPLTDPLPWPSPPSFPTLPPSAPPPSPQQEPPPQPE